MIEYYRLRAPEFEEIYHNEDEIRRDERIGIIKTLKQAFKALIVLEIACGTGYWTRILSSVAKKIVAIDMAPEMLEIARNKKYSCPVEFHMADAYHLPFTSHSYDAGLANFWFSHVPKNKIAAFLESFHQRLKPGGMVLMADDVFQEGVGGKFITIEGDDNTYKLRTLKDDSKHRVLKNYYSKNELISIFGGFVEHFSADNVFHGKRCWYVRYTLP